MVPIKTLTILSILATLTLGKINFELPTLQFPTVLVNTPEIRLEKFMNDSQLFSEARDFALAKHTMFKEKQFSELPNKGANLMKSESSPDTAFEHLKKKADKGIVLRIENYSNKLLADPISYIRCGYEDKTFPVFQTLKPGAMDIALLHNKDKSFRSSCGSISWQIYDRKSKPHLLSDGRGVRLFIVWSNLDTMGSNKCKDGKRNEFIVGFQKVDMDSTSHYVEDDRKALYKLYMEEDILAQFTVPSTRNTSNGIVDSLSVFAQSKDTDMKMLAEMGTGCLTNLTIQILGEKDSELKATDLGIGEEKTPDEVWEQMIRQSWIDIVSSTNKDRSLYGIGLDPLLIDPLVKEQIYVNTSTLGYEIEFWMWNISIDGLADLKLDRLTLDRGPVLKNLDTKAVLNLGNLTVKGTYKFQAKYTGWMWGMSNLDSEGEQDFSIALTNAMFKVEIGMDTVNGCNRTSDVIFTYLRFPLEYDEVDFNFANLGGVLESVVGIVGGMAISISETAVIDAVNGVLKSEVSTLLCDLSSKPAPLDRLSVTVDEDKDPRWHAILTEGTQHWGIQSLRRDILAEKFVTKIFNDGVAKHFANPSDPITKLLDPFQNLPVSEPFKKKAIVKGHVVVCNFWLNGLRKLHLHDMQLARNEDLTYSALKLKIGIPHLTMTADYRLNKVKVFSVIPAAQSKGSMDIALTNVVVDLFVVLRAKTIRDQGNASISVDNFEVNFGKDNVDFKITGLAKGLNKITNQLVDLLGNKILDIQREMLNKEIKNILWGVAECVMYKPAMGMTKCLDAFWESLGFKVPFTFPPCQEMFDEADKTPLPF